MQGFNDMMVLKMGADQVRYLGDPLQHATTVH